MPIRDRLFPVLAMGLLMLVATASVLVAEKPQLPLLDFHRSDSYQKFKAIEPDGYFAVGLRYIHPPRVEWQAVEGAARYELLLLQDDRILGVTQAPQSPHFIESGWNKTKVGKANIVIQAFDAAGRKIALSRMFPFYVAPDFNERVAARQRRPYHEAALHAFDALYNLKFQNTPTTGPASRILPALLSAVHTNRWRASICYPNLHDGIHAEMLVELNKIAMGELKQKVLRYARSVGDHLLLCRLPDEGYAYGGFIRSTAAMDGSGALGMRESDPEKADKLKRLIEPGKNGYSGVAWIQVYEITGDARYLDAAVKLAEVLVRTQQGDGSWPARVDGMTGEVLAPYASSTAAVVRFLHEINRHRPDPRWEAARRRALSWVMENPMKTYAWAVNFDDVPMVRDDMNIYRHLSNYDLFYFLRYFAHHAQPREDAIRQIRRQLEWADNHFVWYGSDPLLQFEPFYPCCGEQGNPRAISGSGDCWTPMDFHSANLGVALLDCHQATGERRYLQVARAVGNMIEQYQLDDGRTMTWMCDQYTGLSNNDRSTSEGHNFWPAAWAGAATLWLRLAALEKDLAIPEASMTANPVPAPETSRRGESDRLPRLDFRSVGSYQKLETIPPTGYFNIGFRYIHPPRAEWKPLAKADSYALILMQKDKILGVTKARSSPCFVTEGWQKARHDKASIVIEAYDREGILIGHSRMVTFYIVPGFTPRQASKQLRPYLDAAWQAFDVLYEYHFPEPIKPPKTGLSATIMPILLTATVDNTWVRPFSYPNLHDWVHAEMLSRLAPFADEARRAKITHYARSVGDHLLMSRLPDEGYAYGGLIRGCVDFLGRPVVGMTIPDPEEKLKYQDLIEPTKCGYSAGALLKVYELTEENKYLDAAVRIAEVLHQRQSEDGNWPARVNGKTGEVLTHYCTSAAAVVSFLEHLNRLRPDPRWTEMRRRALAWIERNPMKTYAWAVNFDDMVGASSRTDPYKHLSNWDLFAFARHLGSTPGAITNAAPRLREQLEWADNHFVFYGSDPLLPFEPYYPSCAEQGRPSSFTSPGSCWVPMDGHTANMGMAWLGLYRLSGDRRDLAVARAAANTLEQYQLDDGRTPTWMSDRHTGLATMRPGTSETGHFWPAGWALSAALWAQLAEFDREVR